MSWAARELAPERLDDLGLHGPELVRILDELTRINRLLGTTPALAGAVRREVGAGPVRIVDVGCGSGDVLRAVRDRLIADGIEADLLGLDGNPATVALARERSEGVAFEVADLIAPDFELPACDVMVSNAFLYHLPDEALATWLRAALPRVGTALVIGELRRSRVAHALFTVAAQTLRISAATVADGKRAIRRALSANELEAVLRASGAPSWAVRLNGPFHRIVTVRTRP